MVKPTTEAVSTASNYKPQKTNKMYKQNTPAKTTLKHNKTYKGETIEKKIARIINNKEPIKDGAPIIYSERHEGVRPEYNIRTDRFELAIDEMEAKAKAHTAKRKSPEKAKNLGEQAKDGMNKEDAGTAANTSDRT